QGGPAGSADNANDALSQLGGFKTYSVLASLTYRDPIGRNAARGGRDTAVAGVDKARYNAAATERSVQSQLVPLVALEVEAKKRIAIIEPAIAQATSDLGAEKARFEVGRSTNFDVLRRQQELADSQLRLVRAKIYFIQAEAGVLALTGDLLARYGVSVSGTEGPKDVPRK